MTVSGLPLSLERCLGSLLLDNTLTSWKIFSNESGGQTVTIRLHPQDSTQRDTLAGGWYRKGEAKQKRDRHRWQQYKDRLKSDSKTTGGDFYEKTVDSLETPLSERVTHAEGGNDPCLEVCSGGVLMTETDVRKTTIGKDSQTSAKASTCEKDRSISTQDECPQLSGFRDTFKSVNKDDSEGCDGNYTPSPLNSRPDPSRPTQRSGDNTQYPPPSPAVPEARDSRTSSDDGMETASGDGAEGGWGDGGDATESDGPTDYEWEDTSREFVITKLRNAKCSLLSQSLIKHTDRNKCFKKIVIDRRGQCVSQIVCCSDDVVLTMNTGTGEKDFFLRERRSTGESEGDALNSVCSPWPDIDRNGTYKDDIDELNYDLERIMDIARSTLV